MAKVQKQDTITSPHVDTPCWLWTGAKTRGYASFRSASGRTVYGHRVAMAYWNDDPGKMFVCHRCDIPSCVNPDHLFIGTNMDNVRDMQAKGRTRVGEKHAQSAMSFDHVHVIRTAPFEESNKSIADRLGVPVAGVACARRGGHVVAPPHSSRPQPFVRNRHHSNQVEPDECPRYSKNGRQRGDPLSGGQGFRNIQELRESSC